RRGTTRGRRPGTPSPVHVLGSSDLAPHLKQNRPRRPLVQVSTAQAHEPGSLVTSRGIPGPGPLQAHAASGTGISSRTSVPSPMVVRTSQLPPLRLIRDRKSVV